MGTTIERELPVVLTDEEKDKAAHDCAEKELELRRVEAEAKDTMGGYRASIKKLKADIKTLAEEAETGKRIAKVPCAETTDWPNPTTITRSDGRDVDGNLLPPGSPPAVIETKAPEVQEVEGDKRKAEEPANPAQRDLFGGDGNGEAAASDASADENGEGEGDEDEDSDEEDDDGGDPAPAAAAAANGAKEKAKAARRMKLHA